MENKNVGYLILGISAIIIVIVILFNQAMQSVINNCPIVQAGYECPAHETVPQQTYLSLAIVGVLIIIGLVLVISKSKEKVIVRKISQRKEKKEIDLSELNKEEKEVLKIIEEERAIFQAELIDRTEFGKAKITRILDRLEGKNIVERKRRGMNNVVVMKN